MQESYGTNIKSEIRFGGCDKAIKSWLETYGAKADLIYIDPPSSHSYSFKLIQRIGKNQGKITHTGQASEIYKNSGHPEPLKELIDKCFLLLKSTGNMFVHCTTKNAASVKLVLDDVFGAANFANEIIYKTNHGTNSKHHFTGSHETILFYKKSSDSFFDPNPTAEPRGKSRRNHMKKNTAQDGRVYYSITVGGKEYKYYEDDLINMDDVWDDLPENTENSRYSFEGQRPVSLMERIIASACPEGGLVCDPFCGTGTTAVACAALGREFLMCDNSHFALNIAKSRLLSLEKPFKLFWDGIEIFEGEKPQVKFSNKALKVHLDDYRASGGQAYYENTLLPTEDTLVESWSVGRLDGEIYTVDDFDIRTDKKPMLGRHLLLKEGSGTPCAITFDVFGNQLLHKLNLI